MAENRKSFTLENAQIIFRNFEGAAGPYNDKGDRNFSVILPPELAGQLERDGWNVKALKPREEGDEPTPYLTVKVNFDIRPPRVVMITSGGRTPLNGSNVEVLDYADIKIVDLVCNGYEWEVNGKTGVKAYLKSLFITIEEDELERKYAQMDQDGE